MRYILPLVLLFTLADGIRAQLTAGTHFVSIINGPDGAGQSGGLASAQLYVDEGAQFRLAITPNYGRFLSDHFLIGGSLSLGLDAANSEVALPFGLNLFGRYYFNPAAANNHFFAQLGPDILVSDLNSDAGVLFGLQAGGGWNHFLTPQIALELNLGYRQIDLGASQSGSLQLGAGLNLFLSATAWEERRNAVAGFGQGSVMIGGSSAGLNFDTRSDGNTTLTLLPNFAYFLTDRLALGANLTVLHSNIGSADFRLTQLGIGPVARYYFNQAQRSLWFLYGGFDWSRIQFSSQFIDRQTDSDFNLFVGGGVNVFVTPNVALEIGPRLLYNPDFGAVLASANVGVQFFLNGFNATGRKSLE